MPYETVEYEIPDYPGIYANLKETIENSDKDYAAIDTEEFPELADKRVRPAMLAKGILLKKVARQNIILARFNVTEPETVEPEEPHGE